MGRARIRARERRVIKDDMLCNGEPARDCRTNQREGQSERERETGAERETYRERERKRKIEIYR